MLDRVIVRFKQPKNRPETVPSESLNLSLASLVETDELQPLMSQATAAGCALAFDVYRNREGQPFLINIKQEER